MSAARARRLLRRKAAWIEALPDGGYGIRLSPGRAGRVAATLDETGFRELIADPGLAARPAGGWRARPERATPPDRAGRPGMIESETVLMDPSGRPMQKRTNVTQSAIAWLARRRGPDGHPWLSTAEVAAAHRLELEAERAHRGPSLTMRWDALPKGGGTAARVEPGDRAISASARVERALAACGRARRMVEAVCLETSALQAAEQDLGLSRGAGRTLLTEGLRALAAHYRIG